MVRLMGKRGGQGVPAATDAAPHRGKKGKRGKEFELCLPTGLKKKKKVQKQMD